MSKEAGIHFELYRHLQNAIEERGEYYGVRFGNAIPEKTVDSGSADIVINDYRNRALVVIEAKREYVGGYDRNLDPYSPKVIEQAFGYAGKLGAEYFATYNGDHLVLFRTFEKGVPLLDRKTRAYRVKDPRVFAQEFLEQVAAVKVGELGWEPDPTAFVSRLKVFHGRIASQLYSSLKEKLEGEFREGYRKWIDKQGWDVEEETTQLRFAQQAAYLLMNKLLFYKVLEDTGHDVPRLTLKKLADPSERIKAFNSIIDAVDFEAVYEHDPIYDEIPLTERASQEVKEFLEELENYELDRFKHDTIGHIYEDIIPPIERHDLGQYYTPPEIVELITKLTIKDPDDKVLDPGCGSGTFLITAYNRLKSLKQKSGLPASHEDILNQLFGIDINRFPAHLTAINLALQDLKAETKEINLEVQDFFNIRPSQDRLYSEKVRVDRSKKEEGEYVRDIPSKVDVVVANPPYIRQERIKDKKLCREHLRRLGYDKLSERSDIYVYFFTHSTEFLEDSGRIGFITSDKWLTVGYGEDLQQFFLDNFKIKAVISFGQRVFELPLVPTCVTILEKCDAKEERRSNITKFLRIQKQLNIDEIVSLVESDIEKDTLIDEENYRLILKEQSDLKDVGKWNRYLYAPAIYWALLTHEKMCRLKDVAQISRGITSGANDFFYLKEDEAESWNIGSRFLRPIAKSIRQVDTLEFTKEDTDLLVIDIHDYVQDKLKKVSKERITGVKLKKETLPAKADLKELSAEEEYILRCLYEDGHKGLYKYLLHAMWEKDWGRYNPPHKRPTCLQHRRQTGCWFDLGKLGIAEIMSAKGYWEKIFFPMNKDQVVIDCRLYEIHSSDQIILAAILNSSLTRFFRELHCRVTGGGMNEMMVYEMDNLPILDFRSLSDGEIKRIRQEFEKMISRQEIQSDGLDAAVLSPLDLENKKEEISAYVNALSEARREGKEVGLMIEGLETERIKMRKLKGAEVVDKSGQKRLTDF